ECCGFGGTFSVFEKELSIFMGQDRLRDHQQAGAEIITGYDTSCLMHMEGILKSNNLDLKTMHVAEILSEAIS
ncbi:MAG: (Fe-S)-binding protein, partial [Arenicellales bacterium]|nr:(Fe-S)-binding protein [Arenicellales bacterium]